MLRFLWLVPLGFTLEIKHSSLPSRDCLKRKHTDIGRKKLEHGKAECFKSIMDQALNLVEAKISLYAIMIHTFLFFSVLISWDNLHLWQRRRSHCLWVASQWETKHQDRPAHCWLQHLPEGWNPGPNRQRTWSWWLPHVTHSKFQHVLHRSGQVNLGVPASVGIRPITEALNSWPDYRLVQSLPTLHPGPSVWIHMRKPAK